MITTRLSAAFDRIVLNRWRDGASPGEQFVSS